MFRPTIVKNRVTDLTGDDLKRLSVNTLLLDVDNTLSVHHGQQPIDGLVSWIESMQRAGVGLFLISNSTNKRLEPFALKLGLPFVSVSLKPLPVGYMRAIRRFSLDKKRCMAVGDQLFTDILGGKLFGLKTVLTTPILPETSLRFRFKRSVERWFIKAEGIR